MAVSRSKGRMSHRAAHGASARRPAVVPQPWNWRTAVSRSTFLWTRARVGAERRWRPRLISDTSRPERAGIDSTDSRRGRRRGTGSCRPGQDGHRRDRERGAVGSGLGPGQGRQRQAPQRLEREISRVGEEARRAGVPAEYYFAVVPEAALNLARRVLGPENVQVFGVVAVAVGRKTGRLTRPRRATAAAPTRPPGLRRGRRTRRSLREAAGRSRTCARRRASA